MGAGADDRFSVWMEYPIGTWTMIEEVPTSTFSYQHPISICEDTLTFRVGLSDDAGCISFSGRSGDEFADVTPPSPPDIVALTVDSTSGLATLEWEQSPEGDTGGYIIVLVTSGGGVIVDTVYGQGSTSYTWLYSTAGSGPESFTVAAFDTCAVGTPPSPNTSATSPPHTTMHAATQYERCAGLVIVTWTPYVGWPVQNHQVSVQVDGGPWNLLANVAGTASSVPHLVEAGRTYCYLVKAVGDRKSVV